MSIEPPGRDPDTQPFRKVGTVERKRAAVVLGVLAVVALLLVGIMVWTLGSSGDSPDHPTVAGPSGPPVTVTGGAPGTSPRPSSTTRKPPARTLARTLAPGTASCPTSAKCALSGDVGNAVQAVNSYRAAHDRAAATGAVTRAAKVCALNSGNGGCPSGYFWEPVGRSGTDVVHKIAASGGKGVSWLLNPKMTRIQVGWAYLPSSTSYECVLVSNG